jgi:hypothetical protein
MTGSMGAAMRSPLQNPKSQIQNYRITRSAFISVHCGIVRQDFSLHLTRPLTGEK